ncbi:hypothetical protein DVH05_009327 [Phytophthora capsici]|nr:hypothetical protein DVH05_009327 [Phytophthora capsici]|eukprot:jgi/Phyca11/96136/e_gw1.1.1157.1
MAYTLGASSPTLPSPYDLPLGLDGFDATILLEDALLVEELRPLSTISTSDDQDEEELTTNNKTNKPRRATEANRRQIYRRMQKRAREELRRQVVDLNEELVRLRHSKGTEVAQFNAAQTPTFWFWKAVATQQRHERSLAEEEQRALTVSVDAQATYIRTLANIARISENDSSALTGQDQAVNGHKKQRCGVSETELFNAFIQYLDTNCEHIDELFQTCRPTPRFEVRKPDGTLEYNQLYITETIPFSLAQTSRSLKQFTDYHSSSPDYKRCADVRDPENTSARSYRNVITLNDGVKVFLRNRLVIRRYEEGRISAWKLVSEGEGVHNGFQFDETGWLTLKATELGTGIEMCIRRTPMHFISATPRNRERFERAMCQLHDKARSCVFAALQDALIDDVLVNLNVASTAM